MPKKTNKSKNRPATPKKTKLSAAQRAKRMQQLGLVEPTIGQDFLKLQKKYYRKLYATGFRDLENINLKTGIGHDNDFLKGATSRARPWRPEKAQYYRLLRAYVSHAKITNKMDRYIMQQLAEGISYRKVLAQCRKLYKLKKSLYWFYYHCEKLIAACMAWNTTDQEGLLNPAFQDSWADDALLADIGLQDSFLGLPMDSEVGKAQVKDWYKKYGN